MEIRSVPSIPANRPVASAAAVSATAYAASPSPVLAATSIGDRSNGGFISPVLRYDQIARVAVLYYRDTDTGETKDQIPAERVVEEYRRNAARLGTGSSDSSDRTTASSSGGSSNTDTAGTSFTPASDAGGGAAAAPATFAGYTAPPAPGGFSGGGASVSGGASGGGVPGGLVSVTV